MEISNFQRYSIDLDATEIEHKSPRQLKGLLAEAQRGNQKAWEDLWLYGTKLVLKICNTLQARDLLRGDFEDAVAEGNLAIGEALTRWNPSKSSFGTWVWIRVRGAILDGEKAYVAFDEATVVDRRENPNDPEDVYSLSDLSVGGSYSRDPVAEVEGWRLYDALLELTTRQQQVIELRYFEGLTQRDVANILGISQPSVLETEKAALTKLKKVLEDTLSD